MKPQHYLFLTLLLFRCTDESESQQRTFDVLNTIHLSDPVFQDATGDTTSIIRYGQPFFFTFDPLRNPDSRSLAESFTLVINNKHFSHYAAKQFFQKDSIVQLMFVIDHNGDDAQNLAEFLGPKRKRDPVIQLEVVRAGSRITSGPAPIRIEFYTDSGRKTVFVFAIAIIGLLVLLAWKSNLLKEQVQTPNLWRWSLAKTQLAIWTLTVAVLYLLIWIVTFVVPVINETVLALLGISFLTTAISSSQESGKANTLAAAPNANFFLDLIDDGKGASIHRFQNVVFIGVFVCIFIAGTYTNLQFPNFDATQLGLLGISAAGYLGMKFLKEK